jgi:4a-hydroxytetrahydrobiopterin dehydratase
MPMFKEKDNSLEATFVFADFVEAFSFMTHVAFLAERQQHHPDWSNVWNRVHIRLRTHDMGNIVTEKDHALAEGISRIYEQYFS